MGELALAGRDKVTYVVSPSLAAFPDWVEQLVAESTGKDDRGIVPVAGEQLGDPQVYGADRFFIHIFVEGDEPGAQTEALEALQKAGHPVVAIGLSDTTDLVVEMFRAEMAVAAAGAVLAIHPFNQPDVQLAKSLAQQAMAGTGEEGEAPTEVPAGDPQVLAEHARAWLATIEPGDYLAVQAYLPMAEDDGDLLQSIRAHLQRRFRIATTIGYGPRFLHSTGQLHKGGPASGLFLQIVDATEPDIAVPETDYTFGRLIAAQSVGDYRAMQQRGRRVLRVDVGDEREQGLRALETALRG